MYDYVAGYVRMESWNTPEANPGINGVTIWDLREQTPVGASPFSLLSFSFFCILLLVVLALSSILLYLPCFPAVVLLVLIVWTIDENTNCYVQKLSNNNTAPPPLDWTGYTLLNVSLFPSFEILSHTVFISLISFRR